MPRRRALSRGDVTEPECWNIIYNSLLAQVWAVSVATLDFVRHGNGTVYISIQLVRHNMPIVLGGLHITVCYEARFATYLDFHTFAIKSRCLLSSGAPFGMTLRPNGYRQCSYLIDGGCEMFAVVKILHSYLPQDTEVDRIPPHLTWPARDFDHERTSAVIETRRPWRPPDLPRAPATEPP